MREGYDALTDKEKQTLRLLLVGHDAKSVARELGLSVHTINDRLRDARRKLSASSSREAARLLREAEGAGPEIVGDKEFGDALPGVEEQNGRKPGIRLWPIGGLAMISLTLAVLALAAAPQATPQSAQAAANAPVTESATVQAARRWLALVDAGKWQESFAGTAASFQTLNTVQAWQSASEKARVPLGRMLSRTAVSDEMVPAPPNGQQVVRFRTDFANKKGATETISLAREGDGWRVVGIYID